MTTLWRAYKCPRCGIYHGDIGITKSKNDIIERPCIRCMRFYEYQASREEEQEKRNDKITSNVFRDLVLKLKGKDKDDT